MADTIKVTTVEFGWNKKASDLQTAIQSWITDNSLAGYSYDFEVIGNTIFVFAWKA